MSDTDTNSGPPPETDEDELPDDAFISPDEPIVRGSVPDDAFISPDEPIVREERPTVGVVVGMDGRTHHLHLDAIPHLEPEQIARILEDTGHAIREHGIREGLQVGPDAPHFEATLKAYLAGYFSTRL
ncbi:MAG: hypothetical protein D6701_03840 [Gemmatimonadetes bacterium]|nr:MAG: hypothetical protein D6701_03840 [Gemmatimonadota bacterium]